MPSVRYVPTGNFCQHSSGTRLERIRFIIIDDDSNAVFCPGKGNLSADFGSSENPKPYRYRLPQEEARLTGIQCIDSPVASEIPINGRLYANIGGAKGSYLHTSAGTDKDSIGGQVQTKEQDEGQKGKELFAKIHACYHQSQVSNISKFVCWSHGRAGRYTPEIALLFKESMYSTAKFDWQQSPHATVFMYNDDGGVDELVFGDEAVSGLEFVSLGEPIGNYTAGDTSSFISLIPGSDRADQIFNTLMDKDARKTLRSHWDGGSAIMSSSQSTDDGCLMLKSSKKTWASRHVHQQDLMDNVESKTTTGKQLIRTQTSGQAEIIFHSTNPPHRTLTWLPSKIPTQMASKVASFFPGGPPKSTKYMGDKDSPLVPVASLGKPHIEESNKFKKVYERFPRLSRAHPGRITSEKRSNPALIHSPNPEIIMDCTGNNNPVGSRAEKTGGQTKGHDEQEGEQEQKEFDKVLKNIHIQKLITDGKPTIYDTVYDVAGGRRTHVADSKLEVSEVAGDRNIPLIILEPATPKSDLRGPNVTSVLTGKKLVSSDLHVPKFDLRGLPHTCVRMDEPTSTKPTALPKAPITLDNPVDEDPIFKNCEVQRGFYPIYPSDITPKMEFENRVGGLENWYAFPMIQVAREYLPEGMKDTDWSWTDNGVSGEFIPGGIAW